MAFGFPEHIYDPQMFILVFGELICLIDIICHFFMSYKDDTNHTEYETDLKKISMRYLKGDFGINLIKWLPWGIFGVIYPEWYGL